MALLYCPRFQAFDENGDPISGAKLWTYDSVATSTPKLTWSDAARTSEHENPIEADANGVFPQIFGEEGAGYYCVLQDGDENQIDEFLAVQMLGQDASSVFLRDFALNGRLQAYGSAGIVHLEFMPPEDDDVGGVGRIGGAEETQGETLEIDFAATTFTGTVAAESLQVGSVAEPFERLLLSGSASSASSVDLALSDTFEGFKLLLRNVQFSATGFLSVQFSFDGGLNYKADAADYQYEAIYQGNSGSNALQTTASNGTAIKLNQTVGAASTGRIAGDFEISITTKDARETRVMGRYAYLSTDANDCTSGLYSGWTNNKNYGKATHVRVIASAGNLTLDYRLFGVP